jgi:hypothetical protein
MLIKRYPLSHLEALVANPVRQDSQKISVNRKGYALPEIEV